MAFNSPIKALSNLKAKPFPEGLRKYRIVRQGRIIVGLPFDKEPKTAGSPSILMVYSSHYTTRDHYDYGSQNDDREGCFEDFLECLVRLSIISKEDKDIQLWKIRGEAKKREVDRLYDAIREMSKNEFMEAAIRRDVERLEEMLTSDDDSLRMKAEYLVKLRKWINNA